MQIYIYICIFDVINIYTSYDIYMYVCMHADRPEDAYLLMSPRVISSPLDVEGNHSHFTVEYISATLIYRNIHEYIYIYTNLYIYMYTDTVA